MAQNPYRLGEVPHRSAAASVLPYRGALPALADSVFLADGARVIGDVALGEGCSVWFNAVVRGDVHRIRVGARTNIQDGAVIHCTFQRHETVIGADVSIAHLAMIHGCTLGDRVLVGMQATVMDGAVVGDECIIGAGAVVTQNARIPPRSLVLGAPAKVVRAVTDEELRGVLATTARYLEYCKGYDFTASL